MQAARVSMAESPDFLSAPLGDYRVLAQPGPQRGRPLWILDPLAAAIWDAASAGLAAEEIAAGLAARSALPLAQVQADVAALLDAWQRATAIERTAPAWTLRLADRWIALAVDDPELAGGLEPLIAHLKAERLSKNSPLIFQQNFLWSRLPAVFWLIEPAGSRLHSHTDQRLSF